MKGTYHLMSFIYFLHVVQVLLWHIIVLMPLAMFCHSCFFSAVLVEQNCVQKNWVTGTESPAPAPHSPPSYLTFFFSTVPKSSHPVSCLCSPDSRRTCIHRRLVSRRGCNAEAQTFAQRLPQTSKIAATAVSRCARHSTFQDCM